MSSPSQPSKFVRIQTWLAFGLLLLMLALGIAWYGFSIEVHTPLLAQHRRPPRRADDVPLHSAADDGFHRRSR